MTRTKRQENSIIFSFIFFLFIIVIIIIYIFSSIYPKITKINEKKLETKVLYDTMVEIENKGLSLSGFLQLASTNSELPNYKKELINSLDEKFFSKYFVNTGSILYKDFIALKSDNNEEVEKLQKEKDLYIVDILPYYSEGYSGSGSFSSLTNFKFVTYIDSILETFNLKTTDGIGIKDIDLVEEYSSKEGTNNPLEKNIYSIPIKLTIEGRKKGIIQFLHYIENVGKIEIKNNKNEIEVKSDTELKDIKLKNDKTAEGYNIYKHQIIDIKSINFNEYIDSYSKDFINSKDKFTDFIKNEEGNEEYKIDVELLFYVRGYPFYELETYINTIYDQYNTLKTITTSLVNNPSIDDYTLLKIKKANDYINGIAKDMGEIKTQSQNKEKIEEAIKKLNVYKANFETISKIEKVKIELDKIKKQKEEKDKENEKNLKN